MSLFNISSTVNEIFLKVLSQALSMTFIEVLSLFNISNTVNVIFLKVKDILHVSRI